MKYNGIKAFIILSLATVIWIQHTCHRCPVCPEISNRVIILPGDTVPSSYPVITPKPRDTVYISVPSVIDTNAIIRNYFASFTGTDTLVDDSSVFVSIDWTVSQNKLISISPYIANRRPQTIMHISAVPKPKNTIYVGFSAGIQQSKAGLGPAFMWQSKNDVMVGASFDLINRNTSLSIHWRLFSR